MLRLWRLCRGGGFGFGGSGGPLPDPGGVNDQAAWLVEAFGILDAAEAEMRDRDGN